MFLIFTALFETALRIPTDALNKPIAYKLKPDELSVPNGTLSLSGVEKLHRRNGCSRFTSGDD